MQRGVVRSVKKKDTRESTVYNLKIKNNSNYFVNGILVHNCDDPHKVSDAYSKAQRLATIRWFDEEMSTRGNDPSKSSKVIIMQRISTDDLSGHVLAKGGYDHLVIPMEFSRKRIYFIGGEKTEMSPNDHKTLIGWSDPRKDDGELMWPSRFGPNEVAALKRDLGSKAASGQLNQNPTPDEGNMVSRVWWKFYTVPPAKFDKISISWDFTFKKAADTDFVVGQVWGKVGANRYLLDQVRDRMGFVETMQAMLTLNSKWPQAVENLVEEKANGAAIVDVLKQDISGIVTYNPVDSKEARAASVAPQIEAGNLFLPDPTICRWVHDYIEEWAAFPAGENDDMVDATTQLMIRWKSGGWEDFAARVPEMQQPAVIKQNLTKMFWS